MPLTISKRAGVKKIKDMQVPEDEHFKHVPYPAITDNKGYINANKTDQVGELRANICGPCLAAVALFSEEQVLGRGSSKYNEFVSCVVCASYGKMGKVCSRCIALGSFSKCADVPDNLWDVARPLVAVATLWNECLQRNASIVYAEWSPADKLIWADKVKPVANLFLQRWNAFLHTIDSPVKKRGFEEKKRMEKRLGNVTKGIKQQLSGTDKVTATLKQVNRRLKRIDLNMFRGMRDLNNHLRLARAREKYLVRCVEKLVQEAHPDVPEFDAEGAPHQYEDTIARNWADFSESEEDETSEDEDEMME